MVTRMMRCGVERTAAVELELNEKARVLRSSKDRDMTRQHRVSQRSQL